MHLTYAKNSKKYATEQYVETQKTAEYQKLIKEVANAFYRKGSNIQYSTFGKTFLKAPEDATKDELIYTSCTCFAYQVYKTAIGIDIPMVNWDIYSYGQNFQNEDYVIKFYNQSQYQDIRGTEKEGEKFNNFISTLLDNLEVGDIITIVYGNDGHTMLVESIIYDDDNNAIDAHIMHSWGSNFKNNSPSDALEANFNTNYYDGSGSIVRETLSHRFMQYYGEKYTGLTILRPLVNGHSFLNENGETQNYDLNDASRSRLKYSGIDIDKTSDKHTNSVVGLGEEITYTIKITNNSLQDYADIKVVENLSELTELVDSGSGIQKDNTLVWDNISVASDETIQLSYKVKVKEDKENLNKEIVSTGTVADISSAKIKNQIKHTLTKIQEEILKDKAKELIANNNSKKGIDLAKEIYKEAFLYELDLGNLTVDDIIDSQAQITNNQISNIIAGEKMYGRNTVSIKHPVYNYGADYFDQNNTYVSILQGNIKTGDLILVNESNINKLYIILGDEVVQLDENGYGTSYKKTTNSTSDIFDINDELNIFLSSLVTKDGFVILRPSYLIYKKTVAYTVEYYKDGQLVPDDTINESKEVWENDSNTIEVNNFDKSNDKYMGYTFQNTDPVEVPSTVESGTVIKVNYTKLIKTVKGIRIAEKPVKTQYIQNSETLDLTGGKLEVTYNDESTETISLTNEDINVTGFNNTIIRKITLTVEYEGITTTFEVEIIKKMNEEYMLGDINRNNKITITDLILLKRHLIANTEEEWKLVGEQQVLADMNEDGKINITDVILLKRFLLNNY